MDYEIPIKQERNDFEKEDTNDNYLKFDFEVGVKVENDSPTLEDWCLGTKFRDKIIYEDVKEECDIQTCFICLRMFADSQTLYQHNLTHLSVVLTKPRRLYQCDHCSCCYKKKTKLLTHIHAKHFMLFRNNSEPLSLSTQRCIICNRTYLYNSWHSHMTQVHNTERLPCELCGNTFKCSRNLHRHILYVHGNIKPRWRCYKEEEVKCELCPSVFKHRSSLKAHMRNCHSGGVHECELCHSKLKTRSYLLTHMNRVHYNDGKMHPCSICNKVFRSPRYLGVHMRNSHNVRVKTQKCYSSSTNN